MNGNLWRHDGKLPDAVADACQTARSARARSTFIASGAKFRSASRRWSQGAPLSPGWRSFFKTRLGVGIFLWMHRLRLQPGQAELMQPFADRAFMDFNREPALDHRQQIDTPPAHDFVAREIGALDD